MLSCLAFFPFFQFCFVRCGRPRPRSTFIRYLNVRIRYSASIFAPHLRPYNIASAEIDKLNIFSVSLSPSLSLWQSQLVKSHDDSGRCAIAWIDKENWNNNGPTLNPNRIFPILPLCIDNEQLNRWLLALGRWETQIEMLCTRCMQCTSFITSSDDVLLVARNCCAAAAMALRCGEQIEYLLFIARMLLNQRFDVSRCSCGGRNFLLREFHLRTQPLNNLWFNLDANRSTNRSMALIPRERDSSTDIENSCLEFASSRKQNVNGFRFSYSTPHHSMKFNYFPFCEKCG